MLATPDSSATSYPPCHSVDATSVLSPKYEVSRGQDTRQSERQATLHKEFLATIYRISKYFCETAINLNKGQGSGASGVVRPKGALRLRTSSSCLAVGS